MGSKHVGAGGKMILRNQRLGPRRGKLGGLGKQNLTYAYVRARDRDWPHGFLKSDFSKDLAITFPIFPSFPQKEKNKVRTVGYEGAIGSALLPIPRGLLPYLPTPIQHLEEQRK